MSKIYVADKETLDSVKDTADTILAELRDWGRNLNQLTVLVHSGRVQTVYLQECMEVLGKTYEAVNRLLAGKDGVISCGDVQLHQGE